MTKFDRAREWFVAACSWVVMPMVVVGLVFFVLAETRKRRGSR